MIRQRDAVLPGYLDNPIPAFGDADHTADGREFFGRKETGGNAVGRNHEILNDLLGAVLFFQFKRTDLVAIEDRFRFDRFKSECSMDHAGNS